MMIYKGVNGSYGTIFVVITSLQKAVLVRSLDDHTKGTGLCPMRVLAYPDSHSLPGQSKEKLSLFVDSPIYKLQSTLIFIVFTTQEVQN